MAAPATWNTGDEWALAGGMNVGAAYSSLSSVLSMGGGSGEFRNMSVSEVGASGYIGDYLLFQVIAVNSTEYTVQVTEVQNMTIASSFNSTADLVVPGSYIDQWNMFGSKNPDDLKNLSEANTTFQNMGYDMKIALGVKEVITLQMDKANLGISSMQVNSISYARGYMNGTNLPNTTTWWDGQNDRDITNVTYDTFNTVITMDAQFAGNATFLPSARDLERQHGGGRHMVSNIEHELHGNDRW